MPLIRGSASFEIRTAGDPTALARVVRETVSATDTNLPLSSLRTQSEQVDRMLFQERLMTRLSTCFGMLALVLACIGLYGLLSY